jgi:hypothetical protein
VPFVLAAALVTIRLYNYAAVPEEQLAAARAEAARILQAAGLTTQWRACRAGSIGEGDPCTDVLRSSGEFVLRLRARETSGGAVVPSRAALGDSLLDGTTGSGVLITIDSGLVGTIAAQAGTNAGLVLGRAIAHEVGHLLIGTPRHSPHGLMRALWSQKELQVNRAEDWQFSGSDLSQIRRSITRDLGN